MSGRHRSIYPHWHGRVHLWYRSSEWSLALERLCRPEPAPVLIDPKVIDERNLIDEGQQVTCADCLAALEERYAT